MASITSELQSVLQQAAQEMGLAIESESIEIEHPADVLNGDYSTNMALTVFSSLKKNATPLQKNIQTPRALADVLVEEIKKVLSVTPSVVINNITVAGPGFINFHLSDTFLLEELSKVVQKRGEVLLQSGGAKKVIVEYSSPNIAKPFTIGHLRTTIIGDAVANMLQATGWHVFRDNHLGDWGTQFGKQIYAIKHYGNEEDIDNSDEPVKELVNLYIRFHEEAEKNPEIVDEAREWFKKLEMGDSEARRLWKKCIDWSLKEFERIYKVLNITFTENDGIGYGESFFEDKMTSVIQELQEKKLLTSSEGAQLVFFPADKYPPLMIMKKDGATLYATRDLAADKFRKDHYGKDIVIINEVGGEQSLYFQQIYATEQLLGWFTKDQRIHVKHGMYRFKDKKMSTRKGNVVWLNDVLIEAFEHVKERASQAHIQKTSDERNSVLRDGELWKIAVGALKWNDLKREAIKEIIFDWDEILSLQGNSGPYVQYVYARCRSVLEKATNYEEKNVLDLMKMQYIPNTEEKTVLRLLYQFSEVVERAQHELAPHFICTYLFEVAQSFNTFYNKHSILDEASSDHSAFRLHLTKGTSLVLQKGLELLGIQTVEKM